MDFFEHQDKARKNTKLLVFYFALAVVCIIASVYLAALLIFHATSPQQQQPGALAPALVLWNPQLFLYAVLGTLGVVVIGSLYKTAALAKGGSAVAEMLGGRLISPSTTHPEERKLQNVIEEMAIASGVPVPKIYVLDDEEGINAFAAGHSPNDAAIGVTRDCMTLLNRDELQGVIGHEFSHILNGDMRLNLRLIGVLFGILCLAVIGRILLYSRSRSRDKNPLMLLGLALIVIGAIGVFFGRLIQAALSRQREFLADASSVQFTRNPAGLSGALQKIGGAGSRIESAHAGEASHMFFGNGLGKPFLGLLATHPPLDKRIRAIDPGWDGKFRQGGVKSVEAESSRGPAKPPSSPFPFPPIPGMPGTRAGTAGIAANVVQGGAVLPNLGQPTPLHLRYAEELRNSFSEKLQFAAHEPLDATALVYAMLLSPDNALRAQELAVLAGRAAPGVGEKTAALWPEVAPIASRARLPLVNLALPALRRLRPDEFDQFRQALQGLIESDGQIEIFEFVLQKIVRRHLASQSGESRPPSIQYHTIKPLMRDCSVVLSALANVSSSKPAEVEKAFRKGAPHLRAQADGLKLLPRAESGLEQLDTALDRLALASPQIKKHVLEACVPVVGADGLIQERQAELLRAIAETLDCPIPPFVRIAES
ncbi:MAG TPA: M48 family metallopeptidase [Verrucomicrobiae bacterium]|nr:M48 family metallopeptidase [Verrucomicrobiae bacterium]